MNISNLRPEISSQLILMALNDLSIERDQLNDTRQSELEESDGITREIPVSNDGDELSFRSALQPRVSSLENSLMEHINTSIPSLDEMVIRQRGRKKQPSKISWSPIKSPFKTPTKRNSSLHMSLLSPSPAKKLFNNSNSNGSPMVLRNSPRKRILTDTPNDQDFPSCSSSTCSTPITASSTPTKRLKFSDDRSMNAASKQIPLKTLLKAMSQNQLIEIICGIAVGDMEQEICKNLPVPDIRPFEDELTALKRNISRSSPRSRFLIQSKTDAAAFSRASTHLTLFKKAIANHCKVLQDSHAFDALIDYVLMAWSYVRGLPCYDDAQHNIIRKDCFKILSINAKTALKHGGSKVGSDRVNTFREQFKLMASDFDEIEKCRELLFEIASKI